MFLKWVIQKNYQDKPETSDIKLSCYDVRQKVFCLMIPTNRFALSAPAVPKKTLETRPIWTTFSCFVNSKIILFHGSMTFWLWYHIILVPTPFLGELSLNLHSTTKRNIFQVLFYFLSLLRLLLLLKHKKQQAETISNNIPETPFDFCPNMW